MVVVMNIIIYNNTMGFHCGSDAVMNVLMNSLRSEGHVIKALFPNVPLDYVPFANKILEPSYDAIVVNGEGTLHHDTMGARRIGEILRKSIDLGKKTYLVNTVWQDVECISNDILNALNGVSVREEYSRLQLERRGFSKSIRILDLSYYDNIKEGHSFSDCYFENRTIITDFYIPEIGFSRQDLCISGDFYYVDMKKLTWSELVSILSCSEIIVTGRHHAVYAACKARTTFAALSGNTHKIEGLIYGSGVKIPVASNIKEIESVINWARRNRSAFDDLFDWMESQRPWRGLRDFEEERAK